MPSQLRILKINLDADMAFLNAKKDFLIIILMCRQPRHFFLLVG